MNLPFAENTIPLILAPMAGYTDYPFRSICYEFGADYSFTEMVSANAMFHRNRGCLTLYHTDPGEKKRLSVQIFGGSLPQLESTAEFLNDLGTFSGIDLNLGCSVPKVLRSEAGCFLMQFPERLKKIFTSLRPRIKGFFSCKLRLGYTITSKNYLEIAKLAQDCGLNFVTLHSRTRCQGFAGEIDYQALAEMVKNLEIPVIGNGNVRDGTSLGRMLETGVSGVMIGRAAVGNPFIFKKLKLFQNGSEFSPAITDLRAVFQRHGRLILDFYGEKQGVKVMRKTMIAYLKGMPGIREFRGRLASVESESDFNSICDELEGVI
ncbi:MAG: tRNA-dihydrouridine synthase [Candidatus Wallbacteria bacterium]|nr:tRNA-dihydrouridine synthase [Candidatus Wallbacteria bacterium]